MPIRVGFIGCSVHFVRTLVRDILMIPELQDTEIALIDIDREPLDMMKRLIEKDIKTKRLPAKIVAVTTNRRRALEGADYVVNSARIGKMEAYRHDVEIPLKYGVDQCVGDTLGPGGIMYGQRSVHGILDFCKDIREVAKPGALLLNYANPNAMNTWAALEYGKVRTVGLCHGVQGGHKQIAEVLGAKNPKDVEIICAGINHQTWYIRVFYKGREVSGAEILRGFEKHPIYKKTEKVRIDVLRRFGYYSTESNGHLSEYLPWYRKRPNEIRRWVDLSSWVNGESAGYLRHCLERNATFRKNYEETLKAEDKGDWWRSIEHGGYIIEGLETGRTYRGHFNVRNNGAISNLPDDCVVEVPGYVDFNGISIPRVGDLPLACAATCSASIQVQRMSVEAAVHGDLTLLKQAMLHDPLTAAVCDPEEVWQMVDEMLVAQAKWLPQYRKEIAGAKKRLATEKPLGTKKWRGGAALPEKKAAR